MKHFLRRLFLSFKEFAVLFIRVLGMCLLYTLGLTAFFLTAIAVIMAITFILTVIMPVELATVISCIFVVVLLVFGINEIMNYFNGYK